MMNDKRLKLNISICLPCSHATFGLLFICVFLGVHSKGLAEDVFWLPLQEINVGGTPEFQCCQLDAVWEAGVFEPSGIPGAGDDLIVNASANNITSNNGLFVSRLWDRISFAELRSLTLPSANDGFALGETTLNVGSLSEPTTSTINGEFFFFDDSGSGENYLQLVGDVTLEGTGRVYMEALNNSRILGTDASSRLTVGSSLEIAGRGLLGNGTLGVVNNGMIRGTLPGRLWVSPNDSGLVNNGLLVGDGAGGGLRLFGDVSNHSGTIEARNGGVVELATSTIRGGELRTESSGEIRVLQNVVSVPESITNNGDLVIYDDSGGGASILQVDGDVSVNGLGRIRMESNEARIQGANASSQLTVGPNQVVTGYGNLGNNSLAVVNLGVVDGNGGTFIVSPNANGFTNEGVIRSSGTLPSRLHGVYHNANGIIEAVDSARLELRNATVIGGELRTDGQGEIRVAASHFANLPSDIVNNGNFTLRGPLNIQGNVTIDGTGTTRLLDNIGTIRSSTGVDVLTVGVGQTIEGRGPLGDAGLTLQNDGSIVSNVWRATLDVRSASSGFNNDGLVGAWGGGIFNFIQPTNVMNVQNGVLTGGRWAVFDESRIDLGRGSSLIPVSEIGSDTEVILSGITSLFAAIDSVFSNSGTFRLLDGRGFSASFGFNNSGLLELDGGTFSSPVLTNTGQLAGTGSVSGSLVNSGTLAPGFSPGEFSIGQDLTLDSASILSAEVGNGASDLITVGGTATLDGLLDIMLIDGLATDLPMTILSASSISGVFLNAPNGSRLSTGDGLGSFIVNYGADSTFDASSVVLSNYVVIPEPSALVLGVLAFGILLRVRRHPTICMK